MQVRTWWGVGIIGLIMLAGLALSAYLFIQPGLTDDQPGWTPYWGALWLTAIVVILLVVLVRYLVRERRERRVRRERGVPEPAWALGGVRIRIRAARLLDRASHLQLEAGQQKVNSCADLTW
jgi:hypothetical protein